MSLSSGLVTITFEDDRSEPRPVWPVVVNWSHVPRQNDYVSLRRVMDDGAENPLEGLVRMVEWSDEGVTIRVR